MSKHDPHARKANADLRKLLGRTKEVEQAIKKTKNIKWLSGVEIDYAHTLAHVYHEITGGNDGKQKIS